jgi:hypothetical protein
MQTQILAQMSAFNVLVLELLENGQDALGDTVQPKLRREKRAPSTDSSSARQGYNNGMASIALYPRGLVGSAKRA